MTEPKTSKAKRRYAREPGLAEANRSAAAPKPKRVTKISQMVALLQSDGGATLEQLAKTTGWQPHTARAALTGLKKKGHAIERGERDGTSVYRITASPA